MAVTCPFCYREVEVAPHTAISCPVCGVRLAVAGSREEATDLLEPLDDVLVVKRLPQHVLAATWSPDELLSTSRVARVLGVHYTRVLQLIYSGRLPAQRKPPSHRRYRRGHWRIRRDDVLKALSRQQKEEA